MSARCISTSSSRTPRARITRRQFARRAAVIGLSMPFVGAVIAACGDDDDDDDRLGRHRVDAGHWRVDGHDGGRRPGHAGRHHPRRLADPRRPRPDPDAGPRRLRPRSPSRFEFLATLGARRPDRARSRRVVGAQRDRSTSGRSTCARASCGTTARRSRRPTWRRRWTASSRPPTPACAGVIEAGAVDATDPAVAVFNLAAPNGNLPALVSCFNAQTAITPADYETGTTLDARPDRHRRLDPRPLRRRHRLHVHAQPRLVGRPDAARLAPSSRSSTTSARCSPACRAAPSTRWCSSRSSAATPCSTTPTSTCPGDRVGDPPPDLDECDTGQFADKRVRQALALTFDRDQMIETLFRGRASKGNDHVIAPFFPYFDDSVPQRDQDIEAAQAAADRGRRRGAAGRAADPQPAGDPRAGPAHRRRRGRGRDHAGDRPGEHRDVLRQPVVPGRAGRPAVLRRRRARHRRLRRPSDARHLLQRRDRRRTASGTPRSTPTPTSTPPSPSSRARSTSTAQKAACQKIETILNDEVPVGLPFFYNFLSGHSKTFQDVASDGARPDVPAAGVASLIASCVRERR